MVADVVFDAPLDRSFSYRVPEGRRVAPGQRVLAPLGGASRVGMVVAVREADDDALKPLLGLIDAEPVLSAAQVDLARWIADESLSSLGSTVALVPPPVPGAADAPGRTRARGAAGTKRRAGRGSAGTGRGRRATEVAVMPWPSEPDHPGSEDAAVERVTRGHAPERALLVGAGRERRVLERIAASTGTSLVLVSDLDAAARWARRLDKLGDVARLDSGVDDAERARAWRGLAAGAPRLGVGTRSALLAPLPEGASVILIDEHDPAHRPPGAPRVHSRDVVLHRAASERVGALFTAATPSVEMWWRAEGSQLALDAAPTAPWPAVAIADTRGILRREPLTPPLARAIREALAAGQRVFLGISRLTSALACDECGAVVRCADCGIALAYTRAGAALACRLCGVPSSATETCQGCGGHRLSPFGWGAERVEHAVRRRFPQARVARYDPEATRGARGEAQRTAAAAADVVLGTRGALRLFGRASLGLAGFVATDQLLRLPDFRASERAFALVWAAAERVRPDGQVVIQSQNPTHYALDAVARQDLPSFYRHELKFRAELGYPPFRRIAVITAREKTAAESERLAERVVAALRGAGGLTVYPPPPGERKERGRRVVVKGHADLPARLRAGLADFGPFRGRGIIEVEVDPVEWQF